MAEETKACNLTKSEIECLIDHHGYRAAGSIDERLERMNYLNRRLKSFGEAEIIKEDNNVKQQAAVPTAAASGWPTNG